MNLLFLLRYCDLSFMLVTIIIAGVMHNYSLIMYNFMRHIDDNVYGF